MTNKLTKKVKEMFFNRKIRLKSCESKEKYLYLQRLPTRRHIINNNS